MAIHESVRKEIYLLINSEFNQLNHYLHCLEYAKKLENYKVIGVMERLIKDEKRHANTFIGFLKEDGLSTEEILKGIKDNFEDFQKVKDLEKEFLKFIDNADKHKEIKIARFIKALVIEEDLHNKLLFGLFSDPNLVPE